MLTGISFGFYNLLLRDCLPCRIRGKKEMYKTKNIRLLSELPDPFTKSDLVKLRRKYGMEGECAYILTRWMKAGFVDYEGKQYKKIATPNDKTKNS